MISLKKKIELLHKAYGSVEEFKEVTDTIDLSYDDKDNIFYIPFDLRTLIKHTLKEEGVTAQDLALVIGMHKTHLSAYLKGNRGIPYDKLEKILGLLFFGRSMPRSAIGNTHLSTFKNKG